MFRIPSRAPRALLSSFLVAGTCAAVGLTAAPAHADARRVVVDVAGSAMTAAATGSVHALAGSDLVQVEVVFDLQDEAGATALATAVSTPGSPDYRRFLSPVEWIDRFAPTQQTIDTFVATAEDGGLTIDSIPASRLFVLATGTVDDVTRVFDTALRGIDTNGERLVTPVRDVSLPTAAARHVRTVLFDRPSAHSDAVPATVSSSAVRCSSYWRQHTASMPKAYSTTKAPTALCGYTAKQLRAVSGLGSSTLSGAGQTVAVIDAFGSSTIRSDLATYSRRNGLPAPSYTQLVPARRTWRTDSSCSPSGWALEQTMDLEAVHAIAPRARLTYMGAADCEFGLDTAMSRVLDQRLASIVSNSWGGVALDTAAAEAGAPEAVAVNVHQHLQAAAEGIGLYFASGDLGDESALFGERAVDFPASSPWITAVGGTTAALTKHRTTAFRTSWENRLGLAKRGSKHWTAKPGSLFAGGAGGGTSSLFGAPAYQRGVVPVTLSHGRRTVTDVSALAAPETGFAVGVRIRGTYRSLATGGTSLATPIVAAQVALAQQRSGRQLGFLNPALYRARGALTDVRATTVPRFALWAASGGRIALTTFNRGGSLRTGPGYDLPTGLGVLSPSALIALGRL